MLITLDLVSDFVESAEGERKDNIEGFFVFETEYILL